MEILIAAIGIGFVFYIISKFFEAVFFNEKKGFSRKDLEEIEYRD